MSIERRMAAKKRAKQAKAKRTRKKIFAVVGVLLLLAAIAGITYAVIINRIEKNAANDRYLNADGTIDAKAATHYVTVGDYKNISVNRDDYLPTESEVQKQVDNLLLSNKDTVKDAGTEIEADSTVALTYKVSVDGTELEDYASEAASYSLSSGKFGTDFSDKIAELKVGDLFDFNITFADDFSDENLAGKTANFSGQVDSVDVVPELTDEFVAEKLTDYMGETEYPKTVAGLKDFVANNVYTQNLENYVDTWISDNTTVKSYPFFYTKNLYYVTDNMYKNYVNQMNSMYGSEVYASPVELLGLDSESAYKKKLKTDSKDNAKYRLAYQAIFEMEGLPAITEADVRAYAEEQSQDYDTMVQNYGYNYIAQSALREKAFDKVMTYVKPSGDETKMWNDDPATADNAEAAE